MPVDVMIGEVCFKARSDPFHPPSGDEHGVRYGLTMLRKQVPGREQAWRAHLDLRPSHRAGNLRVMSLSEVKGGAGLNLDDP
jgi:hypothetical protein